MDTQSSSVSPPKPDADRVVVCGLGRLGQHLVAALAPYGARIVAVDRVADRFWEFDNLPEMLSGFELGDCRSPSVLERAGVRESRAVILVTDDERVNIEAALAARTLNPKVRLVIRTSRRRLSDLLRRELGNLAAYEPTELAGPAFAFAALGGKTVASFPLEDRWVEVTERTVGSGDPLIGRTTGDANVASRRIVAHVPSKGAPSEGFHQWDPEAVIQAGDQVVEIEFPTRKQARWTPGEEPAPTKGGSVNPRYRPRRLFTRAQWKRAVRGVVSALLQKQVGRVASLCGFLILGLALMGAMLFHYYEPALSWADAAYAAVVLLLGGFADIMNNELRFSLPVPWWLRLFGLGLTVAGTVLVGVIFGMITGAIVAARFRFQRRPRPPLGDHVVIVGLGQVGHKVAEMLDEYQRPWVGLVKDPPGPDLMPNRPVLGGDAFRNLARVRLDAAQALVAVTNDEMLNLELGLAARAAHSGGRLVLRTYHKRFGDHLARLFPSARVLCLVELAAEAFAAAAFGERVAGLFYLFDRTVLVVHYRIVSGDTLAGLTLGEAAYGFGLLPLVLKDPERPYLLWTFDDGLVLKAGQDLTVLAETDGLRRVELGRRRSPTHEILIPGPVDPACLNEAVQALERIAGLDPDQARDLMDRLPARLPGRYYLHPGRVLVQALGRSGIKARLSPEG